MKTTKNCNFKFRLFLKTIIFFLVLYHSNAVSGHKTVIYCFPGQGSDSRLFDSIRIDTALYKLSFIKYHTPEKWMNMKDFAYSLISQIDTLNPFVLLGVSLGGMLCIELNEKLKPLKTIIISSAKNRNEFPVRYRFQKTIPLYKVLPKSFLLVGAKMMQPLVEPDRNKNKETFKKMLNEKNATYMKRSINLIIKWERTENTDKSYHIHGDNDRTLPIRYIQNPDYIVVNGSHMMTLTRWAEISCILSDILSI